jgi:hypothetical protein
MYPCTPSTASVQDGSGGLSHSAPLQQGGGCGDMSETQMVRAFFMGRVIERRLSGMGKLGASSLGASGSVHLDAEEMRIARKLVRA